MSKWKQSVSTIAILCLVAGIANAGETLRLGMAPEPYMPFSQVNSAGQWEGMEADLSHALCTKIKVECDIRPMAWDGLIPSLTENKVDFIIGGFSITDERRKAVEFSRPYFTEGTVVVGPKGEKIEIGAVAAADGSGDVLDSVPLSGKIVGVQTSSVQAAYVAKYLHGVELKSYDTSDNSVADLVAGRVDHLLVPGLFIKSFLSSPEGTDFEIKATAPKNKVLGEGIAYAFRKGDETNLKLINGGLQAMESDGSLKAIVDKWLK